MPNTAYVKGPLWADIRDDFHAQRAARAARKALERDLACYRTPAELHELDAILLRHDEEEAADVRRILDRRRAA